MGKQGGNNYKAFRQLLKKSTQKKIIAIRRLLEKNNIIFDKLILFGSYARNQATEQSDFDLCLILSGKQSDPGKVRSQASILLNYQSGYEVDLIVTTNTELRTNKISPILHEIRSYGIEIPPAA